jgi:hypothetical protein
MAAGIDEVALRQAEPLALCREPRARRVALWQPGGFERAERIVAGERDDADPGGVQPEETHGRRRDRVAPDEHDGGVAQELPAKPLAEARGR